MEAITRRQGIAAVLISMAAAALVVSPAFDSVRGLSIDALTTLRWCFVGRHDPGSSPAVVIAIDEPTYRTPPFRGSPTITWTREIGRVVTAVVDGGARVVGFDVVFPTSIEESQIPFGDKTVGERLSGFDRDFLRALAGPARAGKIVLGEVQHGAEPIGPAGGQRIAVGGQSNIRALNVYTDPDDVVRRVPLTFVAEGKPVPAMALELAARALGVSPQTGADGVRLGDYRVPSGVAETMTVNFDGGSDDIPTYSLADLHACADKGDAAFFHRNFDGKVVIVGSVLDFEDRRLTSKRFTTTTAAPPGERCVLPPAPPAAFARRTIEAVYVHAAAVNDLLRRDAVSELGRGPTALIAGGFALVAALAASALWPGAAAGCVLALALVWTVAAMLAFGRALALPLIEPFGAAIIALPAMIGLRLMVSDRDKRLLRRSFTLYLAPALIDRMLVSSQLPQLGGETRDVTVFFSDLADFTSLSETLHPGEAVALMNRYLAAMTEAIEEHGGFVDKYTGDGIVAVFGAPIAADDHAANAVRAALRCNARLAELNREAPAPGARILRHRIGLNSGTVLVGNIGSHRRFNYTVVGDTVNLASRLEAANDHFGTTILVSRSTAAAAAAAFDWREIDVVRVKGRVAPVTVFEPLDRANAVTSARAAIADTYAAGLAAWRKRDFARAAEHFARIAAADPPAALFRARAERLARDPPGPDWTPIESVEQT